MFELATATTIWDRNDCFDENYELDLAVFGNMVRINNDVSHNHSSLLFTINTPQAPMHGTIDILQPALPGQPLTYLQLPVTLEICGYEDLTANPLSNNNLFRAVEIQTSLPYDPNSQDYVVALRSLYDSTSLDDFCNITYYMTTD